tara:strand:- start:1544 stop:3469 length:1926 start_codon:yes stop_codon:yes gene_type:complete
MAQSNHYYYYKGEKINLTIDDNYSDQNNTYFKRTDTDIEPIQISNIFYIKLYKASDLSQLEQTTSQKNVSIVNQNSFMPLWYKLKLNTNNNKTSLQVCNEFYETGKFADVDPAFMFKFNNSCSNDSDFGSLWGLNNTNNSDIDINICDAWTITEGNGVSVAVLDQGIDKTHNDLNNNISSLSFDAQNETTPSVFVNGRSHGTHVAGTIGAEKDNNLQVVGVAPQSEIMSISHTLSITPNISEELANGINWAWQNGAHIINNSWGDQGGQLFSQLHSALLEDAISNALSNGRNGLGTIMVFASGNYGVNTPMMDYPATSNDLILAVGAIDQSGQRSIFNSSLDRASAYGEKLDIVAPGSNILSTIPSQGIDNWDGTSMAAPHVAGIAALILSVNPGLTVQEVNTIIESTAQKVGGYSYSNNSSRLNGIWNNEMGYGLVDAYAAVQMAQQFSNAELDDIDIVCYNNSKTIQLSNNQNNPVSWQVPSNVTILSSNNSSITLRAKYSNSTSNGWVKATLSNDIVLQEDFKVGVPDVSVITLESFNSAPLVTGTFTNVTARYDWLIDVGQFSYVWEWIVPSSQVISSLPTYSYIHVSPLGNPTSIYIKTRACNECGPSEWKGKWFIVETPPGGCTSCPTRPGIIHY